MGDIETIRAIIDGNGTLGVSVVDDAGPRGWMLLPIAPLVLVVNRDIDAQIRNGASEITGARLLAILKSGGRNG